MKKVDKIDFRKFFIFIKSLSFIYKNFVIIIKILHVLDSIY